MTIDERGQHTGTNLFGGGDGQLILWNWCKKIGEWRSVRLLTNSNTDEINIRNSLKETKGL